MTQKLEQLEEALALAHSRIKTLNETIRQVENRIAAEADSLRVTGTSLPGCLNKHVDRWNTLMDERDDLDVQWNRIYEQMRRIEHGE